MNMNKTNKCNLSSCEHQHHKNGNFYLYIKIFLLLNEWNHCAWTMNITNANFNIILQDVCSFAASMRYILLLIYLENIVLLMKWKLILAFFFRKLFCWPFVYEVWARDRENSIQILCFFFSFLDLELYIRVICTHELWKCLAFH